MSTSPTPEQIARDTAAVTKQISETQAAIAAGKSADEIFAMLGAKAPAKPADDKPLPAPQPAPIKVETLAPGETRTADVQAALSDILSRGGNEPDAQVAAKVVSGEIKVSPEQQAKARNMLEAWKKDRARVQRFQEGDVYGRAWFETVTSVIAATPTSE